MGKNFNFKQISNSYVIQEPNQVGQAIKERRRMTWHQEPKKDVTSCEKLRLGANIQTRRYPNGETRYGNTVSLHGKYIAMWKPSELKHLSRRRKRKKHRFPKSSGERKGKRGQTRDSNIFGVDCIIDSIFLAEVYGRHTIVGNSPGKGY